MAMKRPGIYAPLSAYYFDDAAIMEVGEDAELLYVRMLAYAARQMEFEGFISDRVILTRLGIMPRESGNGTGNGTGNVPGTDAGSRAGLLAEYGLLTREEGGYRISGWLKWNKSAAELGKERSRDRQRKTMPDKAPSVPAPNRGRETVRETGRETMRESGDNDQTRPDTDHIESGDPSISAPSNLPATIDASATAAAKTTTTKGKRLPEDWTPARTTANEKAEADHDPDWLRRQLDRFRDHWAAQSGTKGVKADWDATWRNWIRRATDFEPKRTNRMGDLTNNDWSAMAARLQERSTE